MPASMSYEAPDENVSIVAALKKYELHNGNSLLSHLDYTLVEQGFEAIVDERYPVQNNVPLTSQRITYSNALLQIAQDEMISKKKYDVDLLGDLEQLTESTAYDHYYGGNTFESIYEELRDSFVDNPYLNGRIVAKHRWLDNSDNTVKEALSKFDSYCEENNYSPDLIVGIASGGNPVALAMGKYMDVDVEIVRYSYISQGRDDKEMKTFADQGQRLKETVAGKNILIVDDTIMQGKTLAKTALYLSEFNPENIMIFTPTETFSGGHFCGRQFLKEDTMPFATIEGKQCFHNKEHPGRWYRGQGFDRTLSENGFTVMYKDEKGNPVEL